eukprot:9115498-Pyramimonas_sp.AAC.1
MQVRASAKHPRLARSGVTLLVTLDWRVRVQHIGERSTRTACLNNTTPFPYLFGECNSAPKLSHGRPKSAGQGEPTTYH